MPVVEAIIECLRTDIQLLDAGGVVYTTATNSRSRVVRKYTFSNGDTLAVEFVGGAEYTQAAIRYASSIAFGFEPRHAALVVIGFRPQEAKHLADELNNREVLRLLSIVRRANYPQLPLSQTQLGHVLEQFRQEPKHQLVRLAI